MLEPLLLKPVEAAKLLGVSRSKVYELLAAGVLPSIRVGHSVRIPLVALNEWIAEHTVPGLNDAELTESAGSNLWR